MSLRVVHTFGRNAGLVQAFEGPIVRIGRAPDGDVVFDPSFDRDASTRHAEARREGAAWVLVDVGSRNGTFVRGERVTRHVLASGDEATFGAKGPRVRFELVGAPLAPRAQRTTLSEPLPEALAPAPAPAPAAAPAPAPARAPAPAVAPPPAPPAGARVGQRTLAMLVSNAVAVATGRSKPRRTVEIRALVDERVAEATAGQRRTARVLMALLLVAFAALGGLIWWGRSSTDDITTLRGELAKLPPDDPRRKDIEGRLGTLHPPNASFGRNLYDRWKKGIFMLASGGDGFCTAFAVRPSVLATNAHCIKAAQKHGGRVVALENESRGQIAYTVTDMRAHPSYRDQDELHLTPDVGVVTIAGRAAVVLELASNDELSRIGAGDEVYLMGFPGRLMDTANPAATFLAAHVGRVTDATGRPSAFADAWLVQHDAPTTQGTSGSPIFDGQGHVVAINAGGYLEEGDETISGKKTDVVRDSPYKFGMRVDLLGAVLR